MERSLVISFLSLRKTIGFIGILLPFVLIIGSWVLDGLGDIQASISDYYYTSMRNVFVGSLCAVALFLITYRGYDKRDNVITTIAGIFEFLTALFPTNPDEQLIGKSCISLNAKIVGYIHLGSAGLFFLLLAYMSYYVFTKTGNVMTITIQKRKRNTIYRFCAIVMVSCIALIIVSFIPSVKAGIHITSLTLALETIALWAFGLSWLTKGEFLLKDN